MYNLFTFSPMNIEELREYCLSKKGSTESFPFDETVLVFKVGGKIFLLTSLFETPLKFNVKCDPELAIELREKFACVQPGYHMNKSHWNTVSIDGTADNKPLKEWIDHSYDLIFKSLSKKERMKM